MKTFRASEISSFVYCQRAWWYQKKGFNSDNQAELVAGQEIHERHGRTVLEAGCLRVLAIALILLAVVLLVVYLTMQLL